MLTIVIVSVVIVMSSLFTHRDVALSASNRNKELSPYATVRPSPVTQEDKPRDLRAENREVVPSVGKP
jgi:hypothetical protein